MLTYALADIRDIKVDDADSIIRAFHRGIKLGKDVPLLPDMTEAEKALLAEKTQQEEAAQKRGADGEIEPIAKKAKNDVVV